MSLPYVDRVGFDLPLSIENLKTTYWRGKIVRSMPEVSSLEITQKDSGSNQIGPSHKGEKPAQIDPMGLINWTPAFGKAGPNSWWDFGPQSCAFKPGEGLCILCGGPAQFKRSETFGGDGFLNSTSLEEKRNPITPLPSEPEESLATLFVHGISEASGIPRPRKIVPKERRKHWWIKSARRVQMCLNHMSPNPNHEVYIIYHWIAEV